MYLQVYCRITMFLEVVSIFRYSLSVIIIKNFIDHHFSAHVNIDVILLAIPFRRRTCIFWPTMCSLGVTSCEHALAQNMPTQFLCSSAGFKALRGIYMEGKSLLEYGFTVV